MRYKELTKDQIKELLIICRDSEKTSGEKIKEIQNKYSLKSVTAYDWFYKYLKKYNENLHFTSKNKQDKNLDSHYTKEQLKEIIKICKNTNKIKAEKIRELGSKFDISFRKARYLYETKLNQINGVFKSKKNDGLFSTLTDKDKEFIKKIYLDKSKTWQERMNILTKKFNVGDRVIQRICANKLKITEKSSFNAKSEQLDLAKNKTFDKSKKYFLITCAQNATDVNQSFLHNMESYAKKLNGDILVIPIRYHNPGVLISENDKEQNWWHDSIVKYLSLQRHNLNSNVTVLADVKIQPTNANPLNGFEILTGNGSAILAHPRVHMKSLPVLGDTPKMIFTTGICTKPNYTDSRSGKIGEFHHSYGFVIVEIEDDKTYYIRQVIAKKDGSFNDLYYNVKDGMVNRNKTCAALVKGDIHYGSHEEKVIDRSFNELVPKLKPNEIFLHDVFDGYSINPHAEHNWVNNYKNRVSGRDSLRHELDQLIGWLDTIKKYNIVIVFSNHDDFLNRFIINGDFKKNLTNAVEYLDFAKVLALGKAPKGLLAYEINKKIPEIKCLGIDDSYSVNGWECAVHGMHGANGSRGSIQQFKKLNTHVITGHAHGVYRYDGAVQVGCNCKLKQGYNVGMSSWVHADAIIHNDKKVQHIYYLGKNKEFTTLK